MQAASPDAPALVRERSDPRLAEWLKDFPPEVFDDRLYQSIELMERYSIGLAARVLADLGAFAQLQDWQSADDLCRTLSFKPAFTSAMRWLLERLVETQSIEVKRNGEAPVYRSGHTDSVAEVATLRSLAAEVDPGNNATLDLLDHAAAIYPSVARGEQTGEQGMFGPQGIALWLNYFHNNNITYAVNNWVAAVVAADRLAGSPGLRILEVGAGAGSASGALLRCFEKRGLLGRIDRYVITEPNAFFRRRAQRELTAQYANVPLEWATLNLDQPWETQVTGCGEFDLVYAVNVLHVSRDLTFSLKQACAGLAGDGWLVLGECVRPFDNQPIYPELMFQNLDSFAGVTLDPEIRPRPGFLTPEQWRRALARCGFNQIEVSPDIEKIRDVYSHFFTAAICGQKSVTDEFAGARS